jgi:hypothetical protein
MKNGDLPQMKSKINRAKKYMSPWLIFVATALFATSCKDANLYKKYKNYGDGYEAAQKGKPAPFFWSNGTKKEGYEAGLNDMNASHKQSPVEFQYTQEEVSALDKKWDTFEEMVTAAFNGDDDAMFAVGLCYLYGGKGLPIDVSKANIFFAKAASLGHASSLEKIRGMYWEQLNEDMSKGLLHQVYLNLIIARGHTEYTFQYHKIRTTLIENLGEKGKLLSDEIERIAGEKLNAIYDNLDELEKTHRAQNAEGFFLKINDITTADQIYDLHHWLSVAKVE